MSVLPSRGRGSVFYLPLSGSSADPCSFKLIKTPAAKQCLPPEDDDNPTRRLHKRIIVGYKRGSDKEKKRRNLGARATKSPRLEHFRK